MALLQGDECLVKTGSVDARHGDTVLPMVQAVLAEAALNLSDVSLIAAGTGPGSFTGARIALAVAKGLAVGAGHPLVGVGSLCALARGVGQPRVAVAMDAGRGQLYGAAYVFKSEGPAVELHEPFECAPEAFWERLGLARDVAIAGTAFERFDVLRADVGHTAPSARDVALEARLRFKVNGPDSLHELEPRYVRPSDAKLPA
ncbi:MAG: tRNA (adenosine(37)-N6)-threonylcarbamoyltransferase complex dimerization subunit type 1 TsaB [Myxococcota bacterium]